MDPNTSEFGLQKTSPQSDPAAVAQLSSELAMHHHHLTRLTTLTEELVKTLQSLQLSTPAPTPTPTASAAPVMAAIPAASPLATISPRLAFPEKFDGNPAKCKGFLLQSSLFVNQQPALYPTNSNRIAFVCSLLTGRALDWATAMWRDDGLTFPTFGQFLPHFREVFEHPTGGKGAGEQLLELSQGRRTAADYALSFRTLAAQTTWVEDTLKLLYRRGLCQDLQSELACRDEGRSLSEFIELSIQVDNLIRSRRTQGSTTQIPPVTATVPKPMQIGATHLTSEERERRMQNSLCLYCGQAGHIKSTCPVRPAKPSPAVSVNRLITTSHSSIQIPIVIRYATRTIHTTALIDSGAAGNFISIEFAHQQNIILTSCNSSLDESTTLPKKCGWKLEFYTTNSFSFKPSIPPITQLFWDSPGFANTTRTFCGERENYYNGAPTARKTACSPFNPRSPPRHRFLKYNDLKMAFSKDKASQLPPHRAVDCAIELLPGHSPPKGRIFPLSQPESEAMNNYINEKLAKGFIRPSTSPASAVFFFVMKKDGGLRPSALEQLRQAQYYTKLDLRNAYNLIRIREGDEWKTAFSTTSGHYEYRVMPFGLSNSPSIFQSFMNDVFRDMLAKWVIIYIDDILIYSNSMSKYIQHVRKVLQRLIQYQLYAKLEKCEFHRTSTSFLGYIISPEGVAMDEKKVEAVLKWPQPRTLKELQRFLGFANFHRRFIRNFSSVAAPLTAMTKRQTTQLIWSPEALQAFDELRVRFTSAPILRHPDPNKSFIVEVDASNTGVGAILSQRHGDPAKTFPCAYFSRKLSFAERNYDVGNRELLAMKLALEEWRHWLEGAKHPFTILTDHKNLEYLRSAKRLNPRQARWALFFTRFQFIVTYRPGSKNTKADALSHQTDSISCPDRTETIIPTTLLLAPVHWDIVTEIEHANQEHSPPSECPQGKLFVPEPLRNRLLAQTSSPIYPTHRAILLSITISDGFSKACRLIPLTKLPSAFEAAEILCLYGLPDDIVSDRGPQFTSRLWTSFFKLLNVNISLTSGYHPQSNGQSERLNQEIIQFLRSYCHKNQADWSCYLMWAEYAQNSLVKPATGITPFQCILGYQPPMFPWSGEPSDLPSVTDWLNRSEETWNQAHTHLSHAIRKQTRTANLHRRPGPRYTPGQWVWLSTRDLRLRLPCRKLSPRYVGPFQILRQITPVSFRLDLPANYRISPTFHMSLLKPAGGPRREPEGEAEPHTSPILVDGEEAYRVHELLDSRRRGNTLQYLVDWEWYGPEERSWVNAGDILDPTLTEEFHRRFPEKPAPRPRAYPLPTLVCPSSVNSCCLSSTRIVYWITLSRRQPRPLLAYCSRSVILCGPCLPAIDLYLSDFPNKAAYGSEHL
ncbi:hypothetical protein M9458_050536 [Cirrhinus mrigala]|uniref:ribonuclease H n=1 Tax=Cirrhinus mrigala TaxID=683832 RepID=A0ABD0MZ28_CIRMR